MIRVLLTLLIALAVPFAAAQPQPVPPKTGSVTPVEVKGGRKPGHRAAIRPADTKAVKVTEVEGITEYRMQNGLRLLLFPDPSKPTITVTRSSRPRSANTMARSISTAATKARTIAASRSSSAPGSTARPR